MSLQEYIEKRDFSKTSEPFTGQIVDRGHLIFVIQKHAASHLHYDFRLEMGGVLKSWAIPKGPATDPKVKHLAMMVEDHPFDYRNFEGNIPKGSYGAGNVLVWDQGTYEPIEKIDGKANQEKRLLEELEAGSVKIILHGQKLKGEFALVKTHGMGENGWLLIKHNDQYANSSDITTLDRSVLSGKTLDEIALSTVGTRQKRDEEQVLPSERNQTTTSEGTINVLVTKRSPRQLPNLKELLDAAPLSTMPESIKPMKPSLVDEPFNNADWLFENKWDGYRAIGIVEHNHTRLLSRNDISFAKFYPVTDALQGFSFNAVIDGEIIVERSDGKADFGALQNWKSEADGKLVYYVFDILWYEGHDLTGLPLVQRQAILNKLLPADNRVIQQSLAIASSGEALFAEAVKNQYEGIVAKKADSRYTSDLRSKDWLKIKVQHRQEVVIGGFTKKNGSGKPFSALLLGVFESGEFKFVGKVGTGFSLDLERQLISQFEPIVILKSPFNNLSDDQSTIVKKTPGEEFIWLKPILVCEVNFAEITKDGLFRQASFKGLRIDKNATDVILEKAKNTQIMIKEDDLTDNPIEPDVSTVIKHSISDDSEWVWKTDNNELQITHPDKVFWPQGGITKGDVLKYYLSMAEYVLPYLKDRPMSLNRFPDGINGSHFYQKDITGKAPEWAKTFAHKTAEGVQRTYLVGSDTSSLLWMANQGCIEINPWFSRISSPDLPDYCVIDLDPDENNTFEQVITAAQTIKNILETLSVPSFPKTSGSTGMHIYIPLANQYSYEQSQMFAKIIVSLVNNELPDFTTLERMTTSRHGKMYLDFLQNRPEATIAGPYSLRPKPGATVSMPLHWDEVKHGLKMQDFTIFNALDRLRETGDLFQGVLGPGIDLLATIKKAQRIYKGV